MLIREVLSVTLHCDGMTCIKQLFPAAGDRFWFENGGFASSFTPQQLREVRKVTLARILCDNLDDIDELQPNVFRPVIENGRWDAECMPEALLSWLSYSWRPEHLYEWLQWLKVLSFRAYKSTHLTCPSLTYYDCLWENFLSLLMFCSLKELSKARDTVYIVAHIQQLKSHNKP